MSLTSFLKQSQEIRTLLREHFPLPPKSASFPSVRALPLTQNYALVGQAFDYLLRFYMQRHNPHTSKQGSWIADSIKASLLGAEHAGVEPNKIKAAALPFLENAHTHHECYLDDGKVTDELLGSCFDLAVIDGLVRAGEMRGSLGQIDPKDIRDLRNLFALIPSTPFLDGSPVYLNPAFAFPSGADCDLLIGKTLIEIKTTKFSEIKYEYYQQLLGYYLLNLNDKHSNRIQRIGIYFSRHGYLWSIDINDIASHETFIQFLPQWDELVQHYHGKRIHKELTPSHSLEELIAQVDALNGVSSYMRWLSRLSDADFSLWKDWPTASYFVHGAIEEEQGIREKLRSRQHGMHVTQVD